MKHFVYFIVFLLFAFSSEGNFEEKLTRKLAEYYGQYKPATLLVNFHQPKYVPGDTAFFSVFILHSENFSFYEGRSIVHMNLTDNKGNIVHHQKVLVQNGKEGNQFIVPEVVPGIYSFEAFVSGRPEFTYKTNFFIAGPNLYHRQVSNDVKVYPEGGHLVIGVDNRVVISGRPMETIKIIDEDDNAIASVLLDESGLKSTYVKPLKGKQYYAAANGRRFPFPITEDGVALVVTMTKPEFPMRVVLQMGEESSFRDEELHLIISSHDAVYFSGRVSFRDRSTVLAMVPQSGWPAGVARASVFRSNGDLLAERVFAIEGKKVVTDISLNHSSYGPRKKVVATLRLKGEENLRSVFSCSVISGDLLPVDTSHFSEHARVISTGLDHYPCVPSDQAGKYTENFLITQKWRGPQWEEILSDEVITPKSPSYLRFTGVATIDEKPVPDSTLITFLLQNNVNVYHAYTKANGFFDAPLLYFFEGTDEILYKAEHRGEPLGNVRINLDSDTVTPACQNFTLSEMGDPYLHFADQKRAIDQSYRAHLTVDRVIPSSDNLNVRFEEEIFGADATFRLSDYKVFPTMEETLREIILLVQHRKHKSRSVVRVWFDDLNIFAKGEPLYIIDGVVTEDTDYFMSLDPEKVEAIKVVHSADKLRTFGKFGENGIIFVETRISGNADQVRRSLNSFTATGVVSRMPFNATDHGRDNEVASRIPDLRAALYWNPMMETDGNGEAVISFYTPDNTGEFMIRLEGVMQDGTVFSAYKTFVVRKPGNVN